MKRSKREINIMEVDTKAEAELLLSTDGTEENVDFSHGDVELLLGDDDVNAFANESFETQNSECDTATSDDKLPSSETTDSEASENKPKSTPTTHTTTGHEYHQHHHRGRGDRGRGRYFRGGPPPGFFPRGGLRPPFPGKFSMISLEFVLKIQGKNKSMTMFRCHTTIHGKRHTSMGRYARSSSNGIYEIS